MSLSYRVRPKGPPPQMRKSFWRRFRRFMHYILHLKSRNSTLTHTRRTRKIGNFRNHKPFKYLRNRTEPHESGSTTHKLPLIRYRAHRPKSVLRSPKTLFPLTKHLNARFYPHFRLRMPLRTPVLRTKYTAKSNNLRLRLHNYKLVIENSNVKPLAISIPLLKLLLKIK